MFVFNSCLTLIFAVVVSGANCPTGGEIYAWGISNQGRIDVVNAHNTYRQQIMDGTVPNQPKGKNLKTMVYDVALGDAGRSVSSTCKLEHIFATDSRWNWIGQNLFISWSSGKSTDEDWQAATAYWFNEHVDFIYPNMSRGRETKHYTQVVWANSEALGCDFIAFYDTTMPSFPYAKLYTCNYGPGGNIGGEVPYPLA